jgi:hypothetical protein
MLTLSIASMGEMQNWMSSWPRLRLDSPSVTALSESLTPNNKAINLRHRQSDDHWPLVFSERELRSLCRSLRMSTI